MIFINKLLKKNLNVSTNNVVLGFKKAYSISLLPQRVENFFSSFFMRIFRVLGGACLVLVITGRHAVFYKELQMFILFFALIQSILIVIINLIKFFYGLYIITKKPNVFEVRNSPLNTYSTHLARLLVCARWGCGAVAGTTGVFAGAVTYDTILEATGREKIFIPFIAKAFNDVFGEPMKPENYRNLDSGMSSTTPPSDFDFPLFKKNYDSMSSEEKVELSKFIEEKRKSESGS